MMHHEPYQITATSLAYWWVKQADKNQRGHVCNMNSQCIWLNLELAKKSTQCLEYIIVHEMVHLLEDHFVEQINKFMPQW